MNSTFRVAGLILLVLALLVGLNVMSVSAQGPTATPTAAPGGQTPAAAPPAAPSGPNANSDNPNNAATLGNTLSSLAANSATWLSFPYGTNGLSSPRPTVTIRLLNGVQNGLNFEVWSPERMQNNWWDNTPVGRGSQEILPDCTVTASDGTVSKCTTNDLVWKGGFGADGTYYVRIVNNTNNAITPELVVTGSGLGACQGANPPGQANINAGQGATIVQCTDLTPDQLQNLQNQAQTMSGTSSSATGAPAAGSSSSSSSSAASSSSSAASSSSSAATSTPAAAPTVMPTETPAASTGSSSSSSAAPSSSSGSSSSSAAGAAVPCTPTPMATGTTTASSSSSAMAATGTEMPSPTPSCMMP